MTMKLTLATVMLMMAPALAAQQNGPPASVPPAAAMTGPHNHDKPGMKGTKHEMRDGGLMIPGPWWRNQELAAKVGLSADQTKKIDQIFTDSKVQLIQMHAALEEEQVRLDALLNATPLDRVRAEASIDKSADLRADLEKVDAKMLLNIRAVLTPEQWTKLNALRGPEHPEHEDGPHAGPMRGPMGPPQGGAF
jgi:Spy/CpxP family protein refolding chaperone